MWARPWCPSGARASAHSRRAPPTSVGPASVPSEHRPDRPRPLKLRHSHLVGTGKVCLKKPLALPSKHQVR